MINIDALNDDEKLAALESIHKSIAESKEIQKKKITTNVELIVKALKKIESDLQKRYDETGQLIANLKNGENGRDGRDGKDGKNGKDGRDGPMGPRGYDGVPGRNGLDGADGVSITDAHIDFDGSLIIHLSSGRVINVGEVVAADIAEKIKVITNGGGTSQGVLDAIASLQAQIDAIASGLEYQGTWNASTNIPALASSVGTSGYYYIVATAGSTNLNGITDWQVGDWALFNGTVWQKLDQTNLVTSVAGRTGAITLTTADIGGLGTIATQASSNVSITGGSISGITDLAIADGGTGQSSAAAAITALTGTQTSGYYLRSNGTNSVLAAIVAADVPTLNQSTTGSAATLSLTNPVSKGGTNLTSLTNKGVLYASSTSQVATGSALTFDGTNFILGGGGYIASASGGEIRAYNTANTRYGRFATITDGTIVESFNGSNEPLILSAPQSAAPIQFKIGGAEQMRLNSSGLEVKGKLAVGYSDFSGLNTNGAAFAGNVGIGTSSPASQLTVGAATANPASTVSFFKSSTSEYRLKLTSSGFNSDGAWLGLGFGYHDNYMKAAIIAEAKDGNARANLHFSLNSEANSNNAGLSDSKMVLTYSGNLGLGVTPSAWGSTWKAFEWQGGFLGSGGTSFLTLGQNSYNNGTSSIYKSANYASQYIQVSGEHRWYNAPSGTAGNAITFTQAMTLDASGRLGIGETSPTTKLQVNGTVLVNATSDWSVLKTLSTASDRSSVYDAAPTGTLSDTNPEWLIGHRFSAQGPLSFWKYDGASHQANSLTLTASSRLGVGTSSPLARIHGQSTTGDILILDSRDTTTGAIDTGPSIGFVGHDGVQARDFGRIALFKENGTSGNYASYMAFVTRANGGSLAERARIDSSGNLLLATTSSTSGGNATRLVISTDITSRAGISIATTANSSGGVFQQFVNASNAIIGSVTQSGTTAVLYNVTSDERLKENIVDAPEFGSVIDSIKVRSYDWKADGLHQRAGFVAQELVTVAPEAVHQPTDTEQMMAVDYSKLVPMLVKEIQSLRKRLADAGI